MAQQYLDQFWKKVGWNHSHQGQNQLLIDGGRMRGLHGKKEERKSVRAVGKRTGKSEL